MQAVTLLDNFIRVNEHAKNEKTMHMSANQILSKMSILSHAQK
jgi:hypothetical protein